VAVVSFHSLFLPASAVQPYQGILDTLFAPLRFCVPVLLTISFMLLQRSLQRSGQGDRTTLLKKRLGRLAIPTLFWFSVAALLRHLGGAPLGKPLLQGYIFPGAYYLIVMLLVVPWVIWRSRPISTRTVLILTLLQGLFFIGLKVILAHPGWSPLADLLALPGRSLPLYWFAYVAMGRYLGDRYDALVQISQRLPSLCKIGLLATLWLSTTLEYHHLQSLTQGPVAPFEYGLLSCLLSVPIGFLCLASLQPSQLPLALGRLVQVLSRYSLGIFCTNGILSLVLLQAVEHWNPEIPPQLTTLIAIKGIGWVSLLGLSLALAMALDRSRLRGCIR